MAISSQPVTISKDSWLRSFMDKYTLKANGINFKDWEEQLCIAVEGNGKLRYLVEPPIAIPTTRTSTAAREAYEEYQRESLVIKNVLIFAMESSLQKQCIKFSNAYEVFSRFSTMFSKAPRILQYDAAVHLFEANLKDGQSVSSHVLKMIEYVETLDELGCKIPEELVVDRVLHSLSQVKGFTQFRVNYNMANMKKSLHELHSPLVQAEKDVGGSVSTREDVLNIKVKGKDTFKRSGAW
ncbi:uncharacterized protein LOC141601463 [Silene latifolia]|uniref:uncharacterized protein LOC141601463 n=1 Tax=Silene latifolia TaxID=37657 RepID=UPI003D7760FE